MKKLPATFERSVGRGSLHEVLADAKRRYANARRRARFWSGNPSLSNFGPTGRNLTTSRMDEKYELAMCDCDSWENRIKELTGKELLHYDPKQDFRRRFAALMSKSANAGTQRPGSPDGSLATETRKPGSMK